MATHKRTRTGCWTCREAGYKCDEQKPFCDRCTRLKITCQGYGIKLKWQDRTVSTSPRQRRKKKSIQPDHASSPASASTLTSSPNTSRAPSDVTSSPGSTLSLPLIPAMTPSPAPDLGSSDKWLLHHWVEHLSSMISVAPRDRLFTPFQVHLTAMAYNSAALRSTILSMAANHLALALNTSSLYVQAYLHQRNAIRELQQCLQYPDEAAYEPALATILMMQVSVRLFGQDDENTVANHLMGAKAIIARRGAEERSPTSSGKFLLSLFAYHDILSSVSRGSQPLVNHGDDFRALEGEKRLESIARVLLVVARISNLQQTIKTRRALQRNLDLTQEEDATGRSIQLCLLAMEFIAPSISEADEDTDIRLTAEAYRQAAYIYLYRTWLDIGAPNPISMGHIHRCLEHLGQVDVASPLTSSHVWPLFTAGCEAISSTQRHFVRKRFEKMYVSKFFPSLRRVMRDVEDVWVTKDMEQRTKGHDGMAKVDCIQVILRRRGREVDLA